MPYTLITPKDEDGTLTSPAYTVGQIRNVVGGDAFVIGLDLNQAKGQEGGAYTLESFSLSVDGTTRFATSEPVNLVPLNFGNGFSDATIVMFNLSRIVRRSENSVHRVVQRRNRRPRSNSFCCRSRVKGPAILSRNRRRCFWSDRV